jgi:hypothetical protein
LTGAPDGERLGQPGEQGIAAGAQHDAVELEVVGEVAVVIAQPDRGAHADHRPGQIAAVVGAGPQGRDPRRKRLDRGA